MTRSLLFSFLAFSVAFSIAGSLSAAPAFAKNETPKKTASRYVIADAPLDPAASEPSEFITAIKNRAERTFWEGRKTPAERQAEWDIQQGGVQSVSTGAAQNLQRLNVSELMGVTFGDQPIKMPESEAFRRSLDTVSLELGRPCAAREYMGWPLAQTEQARVDMIFTDVIAKLKTRGFSITPRAPRSVGSDVSVFTADRNSVPRGRHIMGLWSAGDAGLLLLVCETESTPDQKAAAKKSKTKKTKSKKAAKKPAAPKQGDAKTIDNPRPEVVPGMPAKESPVQDNVAPAPAAAPAPVDALPAVTPPPAAFAPSDAATPSPGAKPVEASPTPDAPFVPAEPVPTPPEPAPSATPSPPPPAAPPVPATEPPPPAPAPEAEKPAPPPEEKPATATPAPSEPTP